LPWLGNATANFAGADGWQGQGMGWRSMRAANLGAGYVSLFEKGFA